MRFETEATPPFALALLRCFALVLLEVPEEPGWEWEIRR